jgi:hypothetical protein
VWLSTVKLMAPQRQEPSRRIGIEISSERCFHHPPGKNKDRNTGLLAEFPRS